MKKLMTLVLAVCMLLAATTAFAAEFTPSVEAKAAPGVLLAWIEDIANPGVAVKELMLNKDIFFTAVSEAEEAEESIKTKLMDSYKAILNAASLADLGLEGAENMIVRDLFQITLAEEIVIEAGQVLKVKFQTIAPQAVAVNGAEAWTLGLSDKIVVEEDEKVTIEFPEAGSVAFLVEYAANGVATSPAT